MSILYQFFIFEACMFAVVGVAVHFAFKDKNKK